MEPSKLTAKRVDSFLNGLAGLVHALPSAERKAEIERELDTLITFLLEFKRRLSSLPSANDAMELERSIVKLQHFVRVAEADPLISRALGLQKKSSRQTIREPRSDGESKTRPTLVELKSMPSEEMRKKLAGNGYTVAALKEISRELGIHVGSQATKPMIVDQIVAKIENRAGYEYLRERA